MSDTPLQKARVLTQQAEDDRDAFNAKYGSGNCSCHITPPCSSCTHPGNPLNQEEDESCWEEPLEAKEMSESKHTPCSAEYVPSTEHHGPYITTEFGSTMCDFYIMSQPSMLSTASGGPSKPMHFMCEMADDNARRFTAAWNACANIGTEALEAGVVAEMVAALKGFKALYDENPDDLETMDKAAALIDAAIAKAEGRA